MSTNAPIFASGSGILLNHEAVYDGFIEQQSMESEEQDAPIFASGSGILLNHEAVYDDYIEQQAQQAHEEEEEQEEGDADEEIVQLDPRLINYEAVYDDFIEQQVQPTDYDASYDGLIDLLDQEDTTPADYKRIDYDAAYDDFIERQEQGAPIPAPKPAPRPSSLAAEATPVPAPKPAPRKRAKKEWVSAFITTVSGFETVALEEIATKLGEDVQKLKGDIFDGKIYMQIRPSRVPDVRRNFFFKFYFIFHQQLFTLGTTHHIFLLLDDEAQSGADQPNFLAILEEYASKVDVQQHIEILASTVPPEEREKFFLPPYDNGIATFGVQCKRLDLRNPRVHVFSSEEVIKLLFYSL